MMKKTTLFTLFLVFSFFGCQKEMKVPSRQELTQAAMIGKWKLRQVTDRFHTTYTNADPCIADDFFEFTDHDATISQGDCIEFPDKQQTIRFSWKFISDDMVDMGGDTVQVVVKGDTALLFKRPDPEFLEYHWYRGR